MFQNKETKEYTLAIRGTEPSDTGDLKTDARMALGYIPQGQYNDMLRFYNQCKAKYPTMTESKSLNISRAFTRWSIGSNAYIKSL